MVQLSLCSVDYENTRITKHALEVYYQNVDVGHDTGENECSKECQ